MNQSYFSKRNSKKKSFLKRMTTANENDFNLADENLFQGPFLRWGNLSETEKITAATMALTPLWWALGWAYYLPTLTFSLLLRHFWEQRDLGLKKPNTTIVFSVAFAFFTSTCLYFYNSSHNIGFTPSTVIFLLNIWICPAFILWYVKSHNIQLRLPVVAWGFSAIVLYMLASWLFIFVVKRQGDFVTMPTLIAYALGVRGEYQPGAGNGNYLWPYVPGDVSIPGMVRYCFFFSGPEALSTVAGCACLLSLDVKKRSWSLPLFCGSCFLLLLSGTRSSWLAMPAVLAFRYFLLSGRAWGLQFVFGMIAVLSFSLMTVPPITNAVLDITSSTASATGELRGDSTDVRAEIYQRTFEGILKASDAQLFFGHVVKGETVLPGYAPAQIGSHSFLLGTLLYRSGIIGSILFLIYWFSLIYWFYQQRHIKPIFCFMTPLMFSLTFCVMELEQPIPLLILVCALTYQPASETTQKSTHFLTTTR